MQTLLDCDHWECVWMFADSLYFGEECFPARPCESYDDANDVSSSIRLIRNLDCHFVVTTRNCEIEGQ